MLSSTRIYFPMITIEFYLYLFAKISVFFPPENIPSSPEQAFVLGKDGGVYTSLISARIRPTRSDVTRGPLFISLKQEGVKAGEGNRS